MKKYMISILITGSIFMVASAAEIGVMTGNINEQYSDFVRVSGRLVVGLKFQDVNFDNQMVDLPETTILLPKNHSKKVCFHAISKDGFYVANGILETSTNKGGQYYFQRKQGWILNKKTSNYTNKDFATKASIGNTCNVNRKAPIVPILVGDPSSRLVVAINTQRALKFSASLNVATLATLQGDCRKLNYSPSRAFDSECTFEIPESVVGMAEIIIRRVPKRGPIREDATAIILR